MKRQKQYMLPLLAIAAAVMVIIFGFFQMKSIFRTRLYAERSDQLRQLTIQVSKTFRNALQDNWDSVETIENLFLAQEYASSEEISAQAAQIKQTMGLGADDAILLFLDENGRCYDSTGERGIWGDFDQVAGSKDRYTFIADSVTYDDVHWAFAQRLTEPVTTADGETSIRYVVLLKPVESLSQYYESDAYKDVCETYILKENGTRMYDSVTSEDTFQNYNIYSALRDYGDDYSEDFDEMTEELSSDGVAVNSCTFEGTEYCYALAKLENYDVVLLFLIPSLQVATNTVSMVSFITEVFAVFAFILTVFFCVAIYILMRLNASRRLYLQKEENLREVEQMNLSLVQANKAAKSALDIARSANRAKSSFLSNMSHDIRTPLNAIIGFQQLLERDAEDPEKVRRYSERIYVSSQHLLRLINDILDMSRIESGKVTLNMISFSIDELITDVHTIIAPQAREKGHTFSVEKIHTEDAAVVGDKLRLTQILINLLSNAVKYTGQGGRIHLRAERIGTQDGRMAAFRFVVRDNGPGMSEEFQKRIFEPFERERTSTLGGVEGTGLGMAITKNLVDLMGGIILLECPPEGGSIFTVEVNLCLSEGKDSGDAAPGPAALSSRETDEESEDILAGMHFLVAEDNEINAEIIGELLSIEDATCEIAKNGEEAVRIFAASEAGRYNAILMDIQMPVMDGYEAARQIRACGHPEAMTIPIAAMTANAFAEDVQKALEAGMNAHIAKPVDMNKVREFMKNV